MLKDLYKEAIIREPLQREVLKGPGRETKILNPYITP